MHELKHYTDPFDFIRYALSCEQSYAGGGKAASVPEMPGWKGYEVSDPERKWRLVDRYWVNKSGMSGGYTCMWDGRDIKMYMTLQGFYPKEATLFLREVLKFTHTHHKEFLGFRGASWLSRPKLGFIYKNRMSSAEGFDQPSCFRGKEAVYRILPSSEDDPTSSATQVGYHLYQGAMFA
ncbi:hypothetical protein HYS79_01530 [Patescibacteria group bacterium]|nr:hypothetical protein [Patescibacteria group bacterium]